MSSSIELLLILSIVMMIYVLSKMVKYLSGNKKKGTKMNTENNSLQRIIPNNDIDNIIKKVNIKKDEIYDLIQEVSKELDLSIESLKSSSINDTTWITCSTSNQENRYKSKEANVIIVIEAKPFYEYDVVISLEINTNNYRESYEDIIKFNKKDIIRILKIISSDDGLINYTPTTYNNCVLIFWKEKNALIPKYAKKISIFNVFPFSLVTLPFQIIKGVYEMLYSIFIGRKSYYKITTGKPTYEPRSFIKLDSWQTVIVDIGKEKDNIINQLANKLSTLKIEEGNFQVKKEKIWYWGINGKEEREQLACIFNRGYVFVHIYAYGEDLYVGWDANLNYATWEEYYVTNGYTNGKIKNIELYSVQPTWKEVNEYDLDDTKFLLETVHSYITQILKRTMKENEIDQEIDFTIVRESRKDALNAEKPKEDRRSKFKRLS